MSLLGLWLVACGGPSADVVECRPVPEDAPAPELPPTADLEGAWRVIVIASRGPASGERLEVRLHLQAQEEALRTVPGPDGTPIPGASQPLRGTLEGDLGPLGAQVPGDPRSEDPAAPGVAVLETEDREGRASRLVIRLGAEANRRGRYALDEDFTVLRPRAFREDGFAGDWTSGGTGPDAGGHFCAFREGS